METSWACQYCPQTFSNQSDRGIHYLQCHSAKDFGIQLANWDGVYKVQSMFLPAYPQPAAPPVLYQAPNVGLLPSTAPVFCGDGSSPCTSRDSGKEKKIGVCSGFLYRTNFPESIETDTTSTNLKRKRSSEGELRVVIIREIPGVLSLEEFQNIYIPREPPHVKFEAFPAIADSGQASSSSSSTTTGQIEFSSGDDANEYLGWLLQMQAKNNLQLIVNLEDAFIPNHTKTNRQKKTKTTNHDDPTIKAPKLLPNVQPKTGSATKFIVVNNCPPQTNFSNVLDFFQSAQLIPDFTQILEDGQGHCNGIVFCQFKKSDDAFQAATRQDEQLMLGSKVHVSLISNMERTRSIDRWMRDGNEVRSHKNSTLQLPTTQQEMGRVVTMHAKCDDDQSDDASLNTVIEKPGCIVLMGNLNCNATTADLHQHIQSVLGITIKEERIYMSHVATSGIAKLIMDTPFEAAMVERDLKNTFFMDQYIWAIIC